MKKGGSMLLSLSDELFYEVVKIFKSHSKPYVRQRALAIIHVAEGLSVRKTATILKVRANTVSDWVKRFKQYGIDGFIMKPRRKRQPKISKEKLVDIISQSPHNFGLDCSRWTIKLLKNRFPDLKDYTVSGIWRLLRRYGISWQKGRFQLVSPDPDYEKKKR